MSDDEVDLTAPGSASSRRNADRRTPRFSWNTAYEETFFRSLCESMQLGFKENHSFKSGAWERAAIALRDKHGAYPEKSHLINKADNARKKFRMWRGLREDPNFLYNPVTKTVTAPEHVWRAHFEREPLSRALRGRPFEHEEYMEILFPDVIGSGGAPKRIMKPRRKNPDGTPSARPGTAPLDPLLDVSMQAQAQAQHHHHHQAVASTSSPVHQNFATGAGVNPTTATATGASAVQPLLPTAPGASALTPPDEHDPSSDTRKRTNPDSSSVAQPAEKRRGRPSRFSTSFYNGPSTPTAPAAPTSTHTSTALTAPSAQQSQGVHASFSTVGLIEDGILSLAEALRSRAPPRWQEQAVDILFRDFSDEDADLQLKIAEKALTDENKAMVFVKMTPLLRQHYVGRLREIHMRNLGGGLGRVGDEAS
jgi:hypothetical protein